jgi:hypothetical protein
MTEATELHHFIPLGMGANRREMNLRHYTAIPVTSEVHRDIHSLSREDFKKKYSMPGVNLEVEIWKKIWEYNLEYFSEIF